MALRLRRVGITRVHPLLGGFEAWRAKGFPLEPIVVSAPTSAAAPDGARASLPVQDDQRLLAE